MVHDSRDQAPSATTQFFQSRTNKKSADILEEFHKIQQEIETYCMLQLAKQGDLQEVRHRLATAKNDELLLDRLKKIIISTTHLSNNSDRTLIVEDYIQQVRSPARSSEQADLKTINLHGSRKLAQFREIVPFIMADNRTTKIPIEQTLATITDLACDIEKRLNQFQEGSAENRKISDEFEYLPRLIKNLESIFQYQKQSGAHQASIFLDIDRIMSIVNRSLIQLHGSPDGRAFFRNAVATEFLGSPHVFLSTIADIPTRQAIDYLLVHLPQALDELVQGEEEPLSKKQLLALGERARALSDHSKINILATVDDTVLEDNTRLSRAVVEGLRLEGTDISQLIERVQTQLEVLDDFPEISPLHLYRLCHWVEEIDNQQHASCEAIPIHTLVSNDSLLLPAAIRMELDIVVDRCITRIQEALEQLKTQVIPRRSEEDEYNQISGVSSIITSLPLIHLVDAKAGTQIAITVFQDIVNLRNIINPNSEENRKLQVELIRVAPKIVGVRSTITLVEEMIKQASPVLKKDKLLFSLYRSRLYEAFSSALLEHTPLPSTANTIPRPTF